MSSDIHECLFVHILELSHRVHVLLVVGVGIGASSLNVIIDFRFLKIVFKFVFL